MVSVAGTTAIGGEADWQVGDWIVSSGAAWGKVDNTGRVRSVAGRAGDVAMTVADLPDLAEFIRDTVAAFVVGGNGVGITHNDAANTLTIDVTGHGLVAGRYWRLISNGTPYTRAGDHTALFELEMFSATIALVNRTGKRVFTYLQEPPQHRSTRLPHAAFFMPGSMAKKRGRPRTEGHPQECRLDGGVSVCPRPTASNHSSVSLKA